MLLGVGLVVRIFVALDASLRRKGGACSDEHRLRCGRIEGTCCEQPLPEQYSAARLET